MSEQKNIKELTTEELESIELKLWREREQLTHRINEVVSNLNIVNSELATRQESDD
jgi:hypothetical protein